MNCKNLVLAAFVAFLYATMASHVAFAATYTSVHQYAYTVPKASTYEPVTFTGYKNQFDPNNPLTACQMGLNSKGGCAFPMTVASGEVAWSLPNMDNYSLATNFKIYLPNGTYQVSAAGFVPQNTQYAFAVRLYQEPQRTTPLTDAEYAAAKAADNIATTFTRLVKGEEIVIVHDGGGTIRMVGGAAKAAMMTKGGWLYVRQLQPTSTGMYSFSAGGSGDKDKFISAYNAMPWDANGDPMDKDTFGIIISPNPVDLGKSFVIKASNGSIGTTGCGATTNAGMLSGGIQVSSDGATASGIVDSGATKGASVSISCTSAKGEVASATLQISKVAPDPYPYIRLSKAPGQLFSTSDPTKNSQLVACSSPTAFAFTYSGNVINTTVPVGAVPGQELWFSCSYKGGAGMEFTNFVVTVATPLTITSVSPFSVSSTSAAFTVKVDADAVGYWVVQEQPASGGVNLLSADDVINQNQSQILAKNKDNDISVSGLKDDTSYFLYFVAKVTDVSAYVTSLQPRTFKTSPKTTVFTGTLDGSYDSLTVTANLSLDSTWYGKSGSYFVEAVLNAGNPLSKAGATWYLDSKGAWQPNKVAYATGVLQDRGVTVLSKGDVQTLGGATIILGVEQGDGVGARKYEQSVIAVGGSVPTLTLTPVAQKNSVLVTFGESTKKAYWTFVAGNEACPSSKDVKSKQVISASGEVALPNSVLPGASYNLCFLAEDAAGILASAKSQLQVLNTLPPRITFKEVTPKTATTTSFEVVAEVAGKGKWLLRRLNDPEPTEEEFSSSPYPEQSLSASQGATITLNKLVPKTGYVAYFFFRPELVSIMPSKVKTTFNTYQYNVTPTLATTNINNTSVQLNVKTNGDGVLFWLALPAGQQTSDDEIKNKGKKIPVVANAPDSRIIIDGLGSGSSYNVYVKLASLDGKSESEIISTPVPFMAGAAPTSTDTRIAWLTGTATTQSGVVIKPSTQMTADAEGRCYIYFTQKGADNKITFVKKNSKNGSDPVFPAFQDESNPAITPIADSNTILSKDGTVITLINRDDENSAAVKGYQVYAGYREGLKETDPLTWRLVKEFPAQ